VVELAGTSDAPGTPPCPSSAGEILLTILSHSFNGSPGIIPGSAFTALEIASNAAGAQPLAVAWAQSDMGIAGAWSVGQSVPFGCITLSLKPASGSPPAPMTVDAMDVDKFSGVRRSSPAPMFPMLCDLAGNLSIASGTVNPFTVQFMVQAQANGDWQYVGSPVIWSPGEPPPVPTATARGVNSLMEFSAAKPVAVGGSITIKAHGS
jgi:hypothetical protein